MKKEGGKRGQEGVVRGWHDLQRGPDEGVVHLGHERLLAPKLAEVGQVDQCLAEQCERAVGRLRRRLVGDAVQLRLQQRRADKTQEEEPAHRLARHVRVARRAEAAADDGMHACEKLAQW